MAKTKQDKVTEPTGESASKSAPKPASVAAAASSTEKSADQSGKAMPKTNPTPASRPAEPAPAPKVSDAKLTPLTPFLKKQKERLLALRDGMLDSMAGVAKDNLRNRAEGSEASAFGMHQADAGSDAYDRDFALSLLSQEQDALYEIEEALKRIENGTYGICEMSGKPIPHPRLEAIPFARCTVECQAQIEKQRKAVRVRQPVTSLFGLTEDEAGGAASESEEEEAPSDLKE
jgi:RNA polymerase-binding transcription factor DksA